MVNTSSLSIISANEALNNMQLDHNGIHHVVYRGSKYIWYYFA